jgi:hypothetical protein
VFGIPGFNVDNVIYTSGNPVLDVWGLGLTDGLGNYLNIWGNGPGNYSFYELTAGGYGPTFDGVATATATVTPVPGNLALLCTGLASFVGIAWMKWRRKEILVA